MIDLLRLCRLYYAVPMAGILLLTIAYALGPMDGAQRRGAVAATLALMLVVAGGYALNDACDGRVDRINAPHRPVAAGRITPRAAAIWAGLLMVAGLSVSLRCRPAFAALLAVVAAGLVIYDLTSKRLAWAKPIVVAVLMTSIYPLAIAQAGGMPGRRAATLWVFPIWLFLLSYGYELLKDVRDLEGDRALADGTGQPMERDAGQMVRLARGALLAATVFLIPPAMLGCGWVYASLIPAAVALGFVAALLPVRPAMYAVYAECVLVGIAALADVLVLGA